MSATIHNLDSKRAQRFPDQERWLTTREIADHLGFSTKWVLRKVKDGLPHARMGARLRFKVSHVEPWLMDQS
jgi:excisionase family DNA binding protein